MDVQDRTTRFDVVTATSMPAAAGAAYSPASDPKSPSFADSLARPQRTQPTKPTAKQTSNTNSSEEPPQSPPEKAAPTAPTASSPTPAPKEPVSVSTPSSTTKPIDSQVGSAASTESAEGVDETIQLLIAGLVGTTAVPPPTATPRTGGDAPALPAPVSLMTALQGSPDTPPDVAHPESQQTQVALPSMPAGLQVGLVPRSAVPQRPAELPATASTEAATDDLPDSDQQVISQPITPETTSAPVEILAATQLSAQTANGSNPATEPLNTKQAAAQLPLPINNSPAQKPASVNESASPRTENASQSPDEGTSQPQFASSVGQVQSTPKLQNEESSRDSLLNFSTDSTSISSFPANPLLQSGQNSSLNRPVRQDAAANSTSVDPTSLSGLTGFSLNNLGALSADLTAAISPTGTANVSGNVPNLVDQLQPALQQAMSQDRELTMTLRPPELGAVRIDLQQRDGQLSARLHTETASAHQLLTEQLPQLREVLSQMGVSAEQVQVLRSESSTNSDSSGFQTDRQTDAQQSDGRQESPQQRPPEPQRVDEPERDEPQRPAILTRTALNLRI